jgi:hypothetical protein
MRKPCEYVLEKVFVDEKDKYILCNKQFHRKSKHTNTTKILTRGRL